jgi:L-ascorbate metabolism protein UlaG (beta-lactamase superfamily)
MHTETRYSNLGNRAAGIHADEPLYLRPTTKLEPLICRWPASPHLIAPATRAMNIAYRYLANLRSFVANPGVHIAAARDPALLGGPFVDLPAADVPRVRALMALTLKRTQGLLKFAEDLRNWDRKLQSLADGLALDHLYTDLPPSLAGLVDFVYDLNDHASIKLVEPYLYDQFNTDPFEELGVHRIADRDRKFVMSTPLLEGADKLVLPLTFDHELIDDLAGMRLTACPRSALQEKLSRAGVSEHAWDDFLTPQPPMRRSPQYTQAGVRVRYFGHACVLVQTESVSVLLDPLTAWQRDDTEATLTFDDLPDFIDYVVISHGHGDHFVPEVLIQLRRRVGTIVVPRNDQGNLADPSMKLMLKRLGYQRIEVLDSLDALPIPGGHIRSVPFVGEHGGLDISGKHCVTIAVGGRQLFFLVDSNVLDPRLYQRLTHTVGSIDAVFIGMECQGAPLSWLYGPLLSHALNRRNDEARRLSSSNCERAWSFLQAFPCSRVYIYAMGSEPWLRGLLGLEYGPDSIQLTEADSLVRKCRDQGIPAERLRGCREFIL